MEPTNVVAIGDMQNTARFIIIRGVENVLFHSSRPLYVEIFPNLYDFVITL